MSLPEQARVYPDFCTYAPLSGRIPDFCKDMALLPSDAWVLVGMHLKPRHLLKLTRTSKTIKRLVDNNNYWTRIAACEVWKSHSGMEIEAAPGDDDLLPHIDHNLKHMLGLEHGFYWGVERFIQRIDELIEFNSKNGSEEHRAAWIYRKSLSLEHKTKVLLMTWLEPNGKISRAQVMAKSTREIAKEAIEESISEHDSLFNRFVCQMEDDPMPIVYKRAVFRKLDHLLWSSAQRAQGDSGGGLQWGCCYAVTALALCRF